MPGAMNACRRRPARSARVVEETLYDIIAGAGLDPQDAFIRDSLVDALNDALRALPPAQRRVVERRYSAA